MLLRAMLKSAEATIQCGSPWMKPSISTIEMMSACPRSMRRFQSWRNLINARLRLLSSVFSAA
jgi:hypothetical protein